MELGAAVVVVLGEGGERTGDGVAPAAQPFADRGTLLGARLSGHGRGDRVADAGLIRGAALLGDDPFVLGGRLQRRLPVPSCDGAVRPRRAVAGGEQVEQSVDGANGVSGARPPRRTAGPDD